MFRHLNRMDIHYEFYVEDYKRPQLKNDNRLSFHKPLPPIPLEHIVSLPQEIWDDVIDNFKLNIGIHRSELLQLRFVCRAWLPRVNYHAFHQISVKLDRPSLTFLQHSVHKIGRFMRDLTVLVPDDVELPSNPQDLEAYLSEFHKEIPDIDALSVDISICKSMPWLPTVKFLRLETFVYEVSTIRDILLRAPNVEVLVCCHYDSYLWERIGEYQFHFKRSKSKKQSPDPWEILSHFSVYLPGYDSNHQAQSYFPDNIPTPCLESLTFYNVPTSRHSSLVRLVQSKARSLKVLKLGIRGTITSMAGLSLLQFVNLEHFSIMLMDGYYIDDRMVHLLSSLPTKGRMTVTLNALELRRANRTTLAQLDTILAANQAIYKVELMGYCSLPPDLAKLQAKGILHQGVDYLGSPDPVPKVQRPRLLRRDQ